MAKKRSSNRLTTLSRFLKWAAQFDDGKYLFRGVSKDTYKIEASACYHMSDPEKSDSMNLCRINEELIGRAHLLGHYQQIGQRLPDLDLLAELQHFGAATCLIDFSRNAQVALWFACQQNSDSPTEPQNGKVFAVRTDDVARFNPVTAEMVTDKKIRYFFSPDDETGKYAIYTWQPKYQNNRIIAQQSVFIFGAAEIEEAAYCIVPKSSKEDILASLATVSGITEDSIFPDAENFARQNAWDKLGSASKTRETRNIIQRGSIALDEELANTAPSSVDVSPPEPRHPKSTMPESVRQPGAKTK